MMSAGRAAAGDLKMTMPTAFTTAMLAWGLLAFPAGYKSAGQTEEALTTIRWGTDYLMKTVRAGNIKQTVTTGYTIVYQVTCPLSSTGVFNGWQIFLHHEHAHLLTLFRAHENPANHNLTSELRLTVVNLEATFKIVDLAQVGTLQRSCACVQRMLLPARIAFSCYRCFQVCGEIVHDLFHVLNGLH